MQYLEEGIIIRGVGGLYEAALDPGTAPLSGRRVSARAKGSFRRAGLVPLPGDRVRVRYEENLLPLDERGAHRSAEDGGGAVIEEILPRRNALLRPAVANLSRLFAVLAAAEPEPVLETADKLMTIAEHNGIEPLPVIGKCDLAPARAEELRRIYAGAGFTVFVLSAKTGEGVDALRAYLADHAEGIAAFAGASGVGKSTLLNTLFPGLGLSTGSLSERVSRGRHTTRRVELYPLDGAGYIADTPGFSMLDFVRFPFLSRAELPHAMRDIAPCLGQCRYTTCTHTKEDGCAVRDALRAGKLAPSRYQSFLAMDEALRQKPEWRDT